MVSSPYNILSLVIKKAWSTKSLQTKRLNETIFKCLCSFLCIMIVIFFASFIWQHHFSRSLRKVSKKTILALRNGSFGWMDPMAPNTTIWYFKTEKTTGTLSNCYDHCVCSVGDKIKLQHWLKWRTYGGVHL